MADDGDRPSDDWGDVVARWTFIWTLILAILYGLSVFVFILPR